ncbi:hypothetical protein [Thiobacillus denitrificans]|uniref:hypothetical protein n=1 Tax=Thiobacillus denitrificans TaxID=36861 RepID=UPI0012FB21D0|nr:hypothetical protein [Thiobacillus denitrificans]
MLWFVIALQAMAPFIHAHAGAAQPGSGHAGHGGFLHVHQKAHADVSYHAIAADGHGAEIAVAQGMRLRHAAPDSVAMAQPAAPWQRCPAAATASPCASWPVPPPLYLAPPPHTLPHALAPPFV